MDRASQLAASTRRSATSGPEAPRARAAGMRLARIAWLAIVVPAYALFAAELPAFAAWLGRMRTPGESPVTARLTPADVRTLHGWGLSLGVYVVSLVAVTLLFQLSYASVGTLLFWRRADERIALFTSLALMMLPFGFASLTLAALPANWSWLNLALSALGNGSLLFCGFVFPDGRFVPRWTRWLALALAAYYVALALSPAWQIDRSRPSLALFLAFVVIVLLLQLYRYHAVSTARQRQQTRWAVLGVTIAAVGNIAPRVLYAAVLVPRVGGSGLAYAAQLGLIMGAMLAIPFTLGVAILAAHLWDIDLLINRALVYTTLTALLGAVYAAVVVGMQALAQALTGQRQLAPVAIVASTLLIAALFEPARRWVRATIDRRFYRTRYDAARTIGTFSAAVRSEVDLAQLTARLEDVVWHTMQPTHVSLWLRQEPRPVDASTARDRSRDG
jgi:hypothetical protein